MRIGVDARELCGHATGVGRYLGGLLAEWSRASDHGHEFVLYAPEPIGAFDSPPFSVRIEPGAGSWWEQARLPRAAAADRLDVWFSPAYTAPLRLPIPIVVAIHDLSFVAHPEWFRFREGLRRRWLTRASAKQAAAIVTISEFSRRELIDRLDVAASKIHVIPPGLGTRDLGLGIRLADHAQLANGPAARPQPPVPALLFVGSIFNRRHVTDLIRAFAPIARAHPDAVLDLVGDNRSYPHEDPMRAIHVEGLHGQVRWHRYVTDEQLRHLYEGARAFAFLSEYEGLGLTPLEALAAGVPPVLLDTAVARESCGEAALYVGQGDLGGTTRALTTVLFDESVRARLLNAAPDALAKYDWPRAARETLAVLESAGGHRPAEAGHRPGPPASPVSAGRRVADSSPQLSIVIVSFNAREELTRCLESLRSAPPAASHEIIVVDNASTDGSADAARRWSDVRVLDAGANLGFARANNIGIRGGHSKLILLLNGDTIVPPGAIDRLIGELSGAPDVGVVGPRLVDGNGRAELSFGPMIGPLNELRQQWRARGDVEALTRRRQFPDWVSGACLLVRRTDAEAVGLLDERYFMYTEDVDFCAAIRAHGRRILFAPEVQVVHLRGRSVASAPAATARGYRRSQRAFYEKHHPRLVPLLRLYVWMRGADS